MLGSHVHIYGCSPVSQDAGYLGERGGLRMWWVTAPLSGKAVPEINSMTSWRSAVPPAETQDC